MRGGKGNLERCSRLDDGSEQVDALATVKVLQVLKELRAEVDAL